MKSILIPIFIILFAMPSFGQRFITKTGKVRFYSSAPLEKIEAINNTVNCAMDTQSGFFVVKILMRSFVFEKELMQEHFNEEYVESDKFPNAFFKGKVQNMEQINFKKKGTYPAIIVGQMTIHGQTQPVKATGSFTVSKGLIIASSKFPIKIADYGISIPRIVAGKIAEKMEITTSFQLKPLK